MSEISKDVQITDDYKIKLSDLLDSSMESPEKNPINEIFDTQECEVKDEPREKDSHFEDLEGKTSVFKRISSQNGANLEAGSSRGNQRISSQNENKESEFKNIPTCGVPYLEDMGKYFSFCTLKLGEIVFKIWHFGGIFL